MTCRWNVIFCKVRMNEQLESSATMVTKDGCMEQLAAHSDITKNTTHSLQMPWSMPVYANSLYNHGEFLLW